MASSTLEAPLDIGDVWLARQRIEGVVQRSPVLFSTILSECCGCRVYLKLENLQETGSFKLRGAANKLLSLTPCERRHGVITVSSGNHGRAVAYVARLQNIPAIVCLSQQVPSNKVEAIARLGATVIVQGKDYDEAEAHAKALTQERGLTFVHPFDDPVVIAGQGTIGLELIEDLPALDTVIVPLSGGGLLSGIGVALKTSHPGIRLIGVSMERAPVMVASLTAGHPITLEEEPTLAEGLAGGIGLDNRYTFHMVQKLMDGWALVSEEEIANAMVFAWENHRIVVEGAGAVGIAALLSGKIKDLGRCAAVVVSGGNVEARIICQLLSNRASLANAAARQPADQVAPETKSR